MTILSLLGKTWQTNIVVWTPSEKTYRYRGEVTFDGKVQVLPPPASGSADVFVSADPREAYRVEIHLPKGSYSYEAFVVPFSDPVGFDAAHYRVTSIFIVQFGPVGGSVQDAADN